MITMGSQWILYFNMMGSCSHRCYGVEHFVLIALCFHSLFQQLQNIAAPNT